MFIHRPDIGLSEEEIKNKKLQKDMADLIIAKHRNGELGRVKLRFRGDQVRYVNPPMADLPEAPPERGDGPDELEPPEAFAAPEGADFGEEGADFGGPAGEE